MSAPVARKKNIIEVPLGELEWRQRSASQIVKSPSIYEGLSDVTELDLTTQIDGSYGAALQAAIKLYDNLQLLKLPFACSLAEQSGEKLNNSELKSIILPSVDGWSQEEQDLFISQIPMEVDRFTLQDTSSLELLFASQLVVRKLKIKSGTLTNYALKNISRTMGRTLSFLDLTGVQVDEAASFEGCFFQELNELRVLSSRNSAEELRSWFPTLEKLVVADEWVTELDASGTDLDGEALQALCMKYPRLQRLDISGCKKITNFPHCLFHLAALDASGTGLDNSSLQSLETQCANLQELSLRGCKEITSFENVTLKRLYMLDAKDTGCNLSSAEALQKLHEIRVKGVLQ